MLNGLPSRGDHQYRLRQEAVLGLGGPETLGALQHREINIYHLNEGHPALLPLSLLERELASRPKTSPTPEDVSKVRRSCVFTTHTPVPAGHDQFPKSLAAQVLGDTRARLIESIQGYHDGTLNMRYLGLRLSHYVNGVGMHHGETSRGMFPDYPIRAITNGVHRCYLDFAVIRRTLRQPYLMRGTHWSTAAGQSRPPALR